MSRQFPILKSPLGRAAILSAAALLLWFAFSGIVSPSERFNALLVPLWILNFVLGNRKIDQRILIYGAGIGIGILGFHLMGSAQARLMGSRISWWEPFQKLIFTAGLFVIYHALCVTLNALITLIPTARELLTAPRGWWLRLIRAGIALCLFAPYIYVSFNIHRFKFASSADPQSRCALAFQNVSFTARDGAKLKGWFVPSPGSKRTIVVVHGLGANKGDLLGVLPFLHGGKFNVVLFDLRGHGDSSGYTTTFGIDEARDVDAVTKWASQQRGISSVGLLAYSMGGASVLYAVGEDGLKNVGAIAMDSTFAEFAPLAREQMNFLPPKLADPLMGLLSFYTRLEIGTSLNDIAPGRYIGQVTPRPTLLIHGTADTLIPPAQARLNFKNAREPKSIYWIEGATHCAGQNVAGAVYEKRVVDFFNDGLK